jgi:uncharacterized protein
MRNPFYFRELPLDAAFCNRAKELDTLCRHAENRANVLIHSPRRYGKTSLVKRVQERLYQQGAVAVYVDFFGSTSVDQVAARLAARVHAFCQTHETFKEKATRYLSFWKPVLRPDPETGVMITVEKASGIHGMELLEQTLGSLGKFIADQDVLVHFVFDEFQEIVALPEGRELEGAMRSHIQTHANASYFFVGSKRRIIKNIFQDESRPFYQSTIEFPLVPLPEDEATAFIIERFRSAGRHCSEQLARTIVTRVAGYPYYIQKIAYTIFERGEADCVSDEDFHEGVRQAIQEEKSLYESMLAQVNATQIRVLGALAAEPTAEPTAAAYLRRHNAGAASTVSWALAKLVDLDYIERNDRVYSLVDPLFAVWVRETQSF